MPERSSEVKQTTLAMGVMSGTSLDGLDLAYCRFTKEGQWSFVVDKAVCIPYSQEWRARLRQAHLLNGKELTALDADFGQYIGKAIASFIREKEIAAPDIIASHGHTVFHSPKDSYTLQIGSGAHIAATTGITTVNDFRSMDVALGGQGAPLVPIGDALLFGQYAACLNLGGFSNISFEKDGNRVAFDICPVNIVMNPVAEKLGAEYDRDGAFAASGHILSKLLEELNALAVYHSNERPSLSREWLELEILPLLKDAEKPHDVLRTLSEHAALQMAHVLNAEVVQGQVLVTGGGAYNRFLVERLQQLTDVKVVVPDSVTVEFKEALVFAFLGVLRMRGEVNVLKEVTGSMRDSCSGAVHFALPFGSRL